MQQSFSSGNYVFHIPCRDSASDLIFLKYINRKSDAISLYDPFDFLPFPSHKRDLQQLIGSTVMFSNQNYPLTF